MRIDCPNCAAVYDIDGALIPAGGRDVQCSTCRHVWHFVPAPVGQAPAAQAPARDAEPAGGAVAEAVGTPAAEPIADDSHDDADDDAARSPDGPPPLPQVDPSVRAVLRAEAEREALARRAEAAAASGMADPAPRRLPPLPAEAQAGTAPPSASDAEPRRRPGRERLPAIDDIDPEPPATAGRRSEAVPSRRPRADPGKDARAAPPAARRRGFRLGFALVVIAGLATAALYLEARTAPSPSAATLAYADRIDMALEALRAVLMDGWERVQATLAGRG